MGRWHWSVVRSTELGAAIVLITGIGVGVQPAFSQTYELQKLIGSEVGQADIFGNPIVIDGDTMAIGAWRDDDNGANSGAVYMYSWSSTESLWVETQKLVATDGQPYDRFGQHLAIDDDVLLVGTPNDDRPDCPTPPLCDSGSVYVFRLDIETSQWIETGRLLASDGELDDRFGARVVLEGDTAVISAPNGGDNGPESGSVYVFRRDGMLWQEHEKLLPGDGAEDDLFGIGLALDGDLLVVGAIRNDDSGSESGSVYAFRFDGQQWVEQEKIVAPDAQPGDWFGRGLSLDGNRMLVEAPGDDDGGLDAGSVYVFRLDGDQWIEEQKLIASDTHQLHGFGRSPRLQGDLAAIGAAMDDDLGNSSGAVYLYCFNGFRWIEAEKVYGSDSGYGHFFGGTVAVAGDMMVVGASGDTEAGIQAGAAYVIAGITNNAGGPCPPCPWDLDRDASAGFADLVILLEQWAADPGGPPDFDGDGTVGILDFLELLANWGPCSFFRDCNGNSVFDFIDLRDGTSLDCNGNDVPDECDIADGTSADLNGNDIPDECEPDCNENGIPDDLDILNGTSADPNGNGIPDECEPPSNDSCEDALVISDGATPFFTFGAATEGLFAICEDSHTFVNDVWFLYTAPCTGIATFSLCNDAGFDTVLAVYFAGSCPPPLNPLACDDNAAECGQTSEIQLGVVAGISYLVRIGGTEGGGSGTLTVSCEP